MTDTEKAIEAFNQHFKGRERWGNAGETERQRIIAAVEAGKGVKEIFGPGAGK